MNLLRRPATNSERSFVQKASHEAYRSVVTQQFGEWKVDFQEQLFAEKWQRAAFEIVLLDETPVGAIWVTDEEDHRMLHEVFLLCVYQGRGMGTQLMQQEVDIASRDQKPLRLRGLHQNRARELYLRLGFVDYDKTDTHFLMEKVAQ